MAKSILKIIAVVFGIFLILLIVIPIAFRGRIVEMVKRQINESVEARVEFGDFSLSLIRNFPNVSLRVDDIRVIGVDVFENDTLADISRLRLSFDLMSLFRGDTYQVRSISLQQPRLLFRVLEDGTANWDIMISEEEEATEPLDFRLSLQRVQLQNGFLAYYDDEITTYLDAHDINAVLRGDLTAELTSLSTRGATIGAFSLRYENMPILSRAAVQLTAEMDADLNDFIFTFRENRILINELPLRFDGMIGMPEDDILMDFTFAAPEAQFRQFLSLVPAIYTRDFQQLTASGSMQLEGFVKGAYGDEEIPSFGINLQVNDGMFRYPDLPASVDGVNIVASIQNPGNQIDQTVVDVSQFRLSMAGSPFQARLNLRTPVSDPQLDAMVRGHIDLGQVGNYVPLEQGTVLAGIIDSDLEARGRMSAIEQERYQDFHAAGGLSVSNIQFTSPDFPYGIQVPSANFRFTPQFMQLSDFRMFLGESDLSASGRIDNILGYFLSGQLLTGQFETRSGFFNLNQLMEDGPREEEDAPMQLSVIRVPENIDFTLRSEFDRMMFGELEITRVNGRIRIANQEATLDNVRMSLLGGTLTLNGSYHTREQLPRVSFGMDISQIDIQSTFNQFNTIQVLAPIGQFATGNISARLNLNTLLSDSLMPVLTTLSGQGSLRSSGISIENAPAMTRLADQVNIDLFRQMSLRDLLLSFRFEEGQVRVDPFDIRFGPASATVEGRHFFDQRMDYAMNVQLPRGIFGSQANQVLDRLVGQATSRGVNVEVGENVSLDVGIGGTFTNPEITFGLSQMVDDVRDQLRQEADRLKREAEERLRQEADKARDRIEDQIRHEVDTRRDQIQAELEERAQRVIGEAQRQADNVRREAASAAERIRQEARQQADRLEKEASGPIAQAAARRAAQTLIREADQRALDLESEAERRALQITAEAQKRADQIRAGDEN